MASSSRSRSRTKKAGQSRMDAAYDHLLPYGFSKKQISSTVKSLLNVYGDDGWLFLEESGYTLVLETILNADNEEPTDPQLPAPSPPPPAPEEQNGGVKQLKGGNEAEKGMEQMNCSGGTEVPTIATGAPLEIEFMDENLLHIIPPGRVRAPLYGYLSETDSDVDF